MKQPGNGQRPGPMKGVFGGGRHGVAGPPVDKAKDFKGTLKRLLGYLKVHRFRILAVFVMAILSTLFTILSPMLLGNATTIIFEGVTGDGVDFQAILQILLLLAVLYLFSSFFSYVQQLIMAGVAQGTVYEMRKEINEKLSRLPLRYFDSRTHGEILSRITNDVDNISTTLQQSLTQLITSIITLVGVIIMMLIISPWLTLITVLTLPLSFMAIKGIAKRSQRHFVGQQRNLGELNGHVEEMYTGHKIVKAFGHEEKSVARFHEINERLYQSGWKAQFMSGMIMPVMMFIGNIGYVFIAVVGGILVMKGMIRIGDIQAFIQYTRQFTHPITQTANIANIIQSTVASAERVFEILDEKEEIPDGKEAIELRKPHGDVEFKDVTFAYEETVPLIDHLNIDVKQGQNIAIVGPTGAGKTTLVNLLMRFYEIQGGMITIDGIDLRRIKRGNLRSLFGMVLQDTWLFHGTIWENIAYGCEGATDAEVVKAATAANADHFIRTLPDGYDTVLNEEASNISQGQKQLLTI
ncbi:MAG TPA: ABC transporter, partial [Paenibacillaceae bacterium]|nr:ABC transporter [Paenibacillaceae bacterium]